MVFKRVGSGSSGQKIPPIQYFGCNTHPTPKGVCIVRSGYGPSIPRDRRCAADDAVPLHEGYPVY